MISVLRKEFPNRALSPGDLQAAAQLPADWQRAISRITPDQQEFTLELHVTGFPRKDGPALCADARQQCEALALGAVNVALTDPDTIQLSGPPSGAAPVPDLTNWLRLAAAPIFDRLVATYSLQFTNHKRGRSSRILLFGRCDRTHWFILKAIWPDAATGDDSIYRLVRWNGERPFAAAMQSFWTGANRTPPTWSKALFPSPVADPLLGMINWFLRPGRPTLEGSLLRIAAALGLTAANIALSIFSLLHGHPLRILLFLPVLLLSIALLAFSLINSIGRVIATYKGMKASNRRVYNQSIEYPPCEQGDANLTEDPTVRKFSADFEALGCRFVQDVAIRPAITGAAFVRIYQLPDSATLLALSFMHRVGAASFFPLKPLFYLRTELSDGTRVISTNQEGGFAKPTLQSVVARGYPGVEDAETMLARHYNLIRKHQNGGSAPVVLAPEELVGKMVADHDEIRPIMVQRGYYDWEQAFRRTFRLVRPEYRD